MALEVISGHITVQCIFCHNPVDLRVGKKPAAQGKERERRGMKIRIGSGGKTREACLPFLIVAEVSAGSIRYRERMKRRGTKEHKGRIYTAAGRGARGEDHEKSKTGDHLKGKRGRRKAGGQGGVWT